MTSRHLHIRSDERPTRCICGEVIPAPPGICRDCREAREYADSGQCIDCFDARYLEETR